MTNTGATATRKKPWCGTFTMAGPSTQSEGQFTYVRHMCKSYSCSVCGPKKLRRARWRIGQEAQGRRLTRLASLTLDPRKIHEGQSPFVYLRETWRKMRVSLARHLGKSIQFIAVVELHKSGIPHLHVLVGAYLPQEWLSAAWQGVGGGKIVDIRYVDVHRVSRYLSKYLTKETLADLPSRVRRFSCSKGIVLWSRKPKQLGWGLYKISFDYLREIAESPSDEVWKEETKGVSELVSFVAECLVMSEWSRYIPPNRSMRETEKEQWNRKRI